jgi:hypothetical protein
VNVTRRGEAIAPGPLVNDDLVRAVWIELQTVHFLPTLSSLLAQRLEALAVHECRLRVIVREDLEQFSRLREISLPSNDLQWIAGDLFDFNPELQAVDFQDNKLRFIGANLLDSLARLWRADFRSVECIHQGARSPVRMEILKQELRAKCKHESTERDMLRVQKQIEGENQAKVADQTSP